MKFIEKKKAEMSHIQEKIDAYENMQRKQTHPLLQTQFKLYAISRYFIYLCIICALWMIIAPSKFLVVVLIGLLLLLNALIWQPMYLMLPKKYKEKDQLYFLCKHYHAYIYRNHYLFIPKISARPYAFVYNHRFKKVTRLSSKLPFDKLFRKEIQQLQQNQPIETNGFLDTAFNQLAEHTLPIIKF